MILSVDKGVVLFYGVLAGTAAIWRLNYTETLRCLNQSVSLVAHSCPTLCDPMNGSMPGLPVRECLIPYKTGSCYWLPMGRSTRSFHHSVLVIFDLDFYSVMRISLSKACEFQEDLYLIAKMAAITILQYNIRSYTPYFFFGAKKIGCAGPIQIQRARNKLCLSMGRIDKKIYKNN